MKRFTLSIILGLIFPVASVAALAFIGDYLPSSLMLAKVSGESAPGILFAPFLIPVYLDIWLKSNRILPSVFDTFWFRFLSLILYNWILYGLLSYWILGRFKMFQKQKENYSETPPPPPEFS